MPYSVVMATDPRAPLASAVPPVRDEMGGAGRPGPVCGGMARDETFNRAAQPGASPRPARVEAGLAGRNRGAARRGRPDWSEEQRRNLQQHAKSNKHQDDVPEAPFRFFLGGITNLVPNYSTKLTMRK